MQVPKSEGARPTAAGNVPSVPQFPPVSQHQTALLIPETASPLDQFNDLVGGSEVQALGQRRLQVGLKELALPAVPIHKGHVYPVPVVLVHADQYKGIQGENFPLEPEIRFSDGGFRESCYPSRRV